MRGRGRSRTFTHATARPRDVDEVEGALRGMPPELKARWPVSHAGVFGSWARREQREGSDLDLPVDLDRPVGFEIVALEDEIERRLGLPVDLVMRGSLRRRIGRRILDEVQAVGGTALPAVRDSWHGGRLINQAT